MRVLLGDKKYIVCVLPYLSGVQAFIARVVLSGRGKNIRLERNTGGHAFSLGISYIYLAGYSLVLRFCCQHCC